jgi:hypothetical protein
MARRTAGRSLTELLVNDPPTYNPVSKEKFKDVKIEAEFKLDANQNSGLYLRGRYELQMALGPGPAATKGRQGMMAIYGWKAADVDRNGDHVRLNQVSPGRDHARC